MPLTEEPKSSSPDRGETKNDKNPNPNEEEEEEEVNVMIRRSVEDDEGIVSDDSPSSTSGMQDSDDQESKVTEKY